MEVGGGQVLDLWGLEVEPGLHPTAGVRGSVIWISKL